MPKLSAKVQLRFDRPKNREQYAKLTIEDHANLDFPGVSPRPPAIHTSNHTTFEAAVRYARAIQNAKVSGLVGVGHNYICDILVVGGDRAGFYHVSQNGRVWVGDSKSWSADTKEISVK